MKLMRKGQVSTTDGCTRLIIAVLLSATAHATAAPLLDQLKDFIDGVQAVATEAIGVATSGVAAGVADLTAPSTSATTAAAAPVSALAGTIVALDAQAVPLSSVPAYVVQYAPYFYIHSEESW